jgi:hypothetical protein
MIELYGRDCKSVFVFENPGEILDLYEKLELISFSESHEWHIPPLGSVARRKCHPMRTE